MPEHCSAWCAACCGITPPGAPWACWHWLFFYRMPGYSGSAQRYLWFVLPSAALTIPASLVEFAIVRHIYNKFKIDNGVV